MSELKLNTWYFSKVIFSYYKATYVFKVTKQLATAYETWFFDETSWKTYVIHKTSYIHKNAVEIVNSELFNLLYG